MKHLKKKKEFNFTGKKPSKNILDTFKKPKNTDWVNLIATEVTSLCPITGQPDYHTIDIDYHAEKVCVESKSLKLYLGGYRMVGTFTETLASLIAQDLYEVLKTYVEVRVKSVSRGGIAIEGRAIAGEML